MFYRFFDSPWFLLALLGLIFVAIELGVIIGRWERRRLLAACAADSAEPGGIGRSAAEFKLGVVQNAVFGVIALLTGFTFGAASNAYQERSRQVSEQADAIAEVWRKADFVDPHLRDPVRAALLEYLDAELAFSTSNRERIGRDDAAARSNAAQARMWSAVTAASVQSGDLRTALGLADSINRLFQRHFARLYTLRTRTPMPMLIVVLFGVCVSSLILGVSWGGSSPTAAERGPRRPRSLSGYLLFTGMMALTVMVIRDLDQPYRGLIEIDEQNLVDLRDGLRASSSALSPQR